MTTAPPTFDTIRNTLREHASKANGINIEITTHNGEIKERLKTILRLLDAVKEKMKKALEAETGNAGIIKSLTEDSTAIKTALDAMETARNSDKTEIDKDIKAIEDNIKEMDSSTVGDGASDGASEGGRQRSLRGGWRFPHREKKHNNNSTRNNSTRNNSTRNKSGKKKSATRKSANKRKYNSSRRRLTR